MPGREPGRAALSSVPPGEAHRAGPGRLLPQKPRSLREASCLRERAAQRWVVTGPGRDRPPAGRRAGASRPGRQGEPRGRRLCGPLLGCRPTPPSGARSLPTRPCSPAGRATGGAAVATGQEGEGKEGREANHPREPLVKSVLVTLVSRFSVSQRPRVISPGPSTRFPRRQLQTKA